MLWILLSVTRSAEMIVSDKPASESETDGIPFVIKKISTEFLCRYDDVKGFARFRFLTLLALSKSITP
jgi:hypothetical protein